MSAGLWTQCVTTLNETQQKAIQDLLNTAWARSPPGSPLFRKPIKTSWTSRSLPSTVGTGLNPPYYSVPSLFNQTEEKVGHFWLEDIGTPHYKLFDLYPRKWGNQWPSIQAHWRPFPPYPPQKRLLNIICLCPNIPNSFEGWAWIECSKRLGNGHSHELSNWMWKGTLGDFCLSLGLFSFLVVLWGWKDKLELKRKGPVPHCRGYASKVTAC